MIDDHTISVPGRPVRRTLKRVIPTSEVGWFVNQVKRLLERIEPLGSLGNLGTPR